MNAPDAIKTSATQNKERTGPPLPLSFRHIGLCTMDIAKMEDFYPRILGMTVTDRGSSSETQMDLVFMSRAPHDHHQIVLSSGRPPGLPSNIHNPMFGPVINQISFQLESLDDLKDMKNFLDQKYPEGKRFYANHGNAWSIYLADPENNLVELYADSPFFCSQPTMQPLDLDKSNEEILAGTEAIARNGQSFMLHEQWHAEIAKKMRRG